MVRELHSDDRAPDIYYNYHFEDNQRPKERGRGRGGGETSTFSLKFLWTVINEASCNNGGHAACSASAHRNNVWRQTAGRREVHTTQALITMPRPPNRMHNQRLIFLEKPGVSVSIPSRFVTRADCTWGVRGCSQSSTAAEKLPA